jgi:hypothetical protein
MDVSFRPALLGKTKSPARLAAAKERAVFPIVVLLAAQTARNQRGVNPHPRRSRTNLGGVVQMTDFFPIRRSDQGVQREAVRFGLDPRGFFLVDLRIKKRRVVRREVEQYVADLVEEGEPEIVQPVVPQRQADDRPASLGSVPARSPLVTI